MTMQYSNSAIVALSIALAAVMPACANILGLKDVAGPACSDQLRNGDETDVDCGGSCGPCTTGRSCSVAGDCASSVCETRQCAAPSCVDQVRNGDETDADCGGSCRPCDDGRACGAAVDCVSSVCTSSTCQAATCRDDTRNGDESDRDCGGTACERCGVGRSCNASVDCAGSEVCDAALCREAQSCLDILQHRAGVASGVYRIMPAGADPFDAFCDMDTSHEGGGWTLLLKASGDPTLAYDSALWTNTDLLDPEDLTAQPGNAKYQSFVSLPVATLLGDLDGFRYAFTPPCDGCADPARTARALFLGPTGQGESTIVTGYPTLGSGPSWLAQPFCHKFGINTPDPFARARFGWTANQEMDCGSNDTAIGLGLVTQRTDVRLTPYGAGYVCLAGGCMEGDAATERTMDAGGNGFLWGR